MPGFGGGRSRTAAEVPLAAAWPEIGPLDCAGAAVGCFSFGITGSHGVGVGVGDGDFVFSANGLVSSGCGVCAETHEHSANAKIKRNV